MKTPIRFLLSSFLLSMPLASLSSAQVLEQVPADAVAVFKVNNLNGLNEKLIKLSTKFGLDQMLPDLKDPLGAFLEKAHVTAGVNKDGDMALAMFDAQAAGVKPDDAVVGVFAVSDYKAFVGNFKDAKEDGEVTSATDPDDASKTIYLAHWGKYAAISDNKAFLTGHDKGFKVAGAAAKEADADDAILLANMDQVRKVALPKFKQERSKMLKEMSKNLDQDENAKRFAPVVKTVLNLYLDGVQNFLEQATNGAIGFKFAEDGIGTAALAEFGPESSFGQTIALMQNGAAGDLLGGLPARKYFLFGGTLGQPAAAERIQAAIIGPIKAELLKAGPDMAKLADALDAVQKLNTAAKSSAIGWVQPNGALGQESIVQQVGVVKGDSKTILDSERTIMQALAETMQNVMKANNKAPVSIDYKEGAKTVDGVSLDQYETKFDFDPNDPKSAQAQQAISMIYGPSGASALWGSADEKTFIVAQGLPDPLLSELISSAKAGKDALSDQPQVQAVSRHLPEKRLAEVYLALDNVLNSAARYAAGFGFAVKFHLPANLPPIGSAVATEGSTLRVDSFIPSDLVQNLISAGIQVQQNMQGGGAGNPGGL